MSAATSARRRLALLAVMAASGSRGVPRDRLLALFWPESHTDRARHALDQTLYQLKRDMGAEGLLLGREELSLDPAAITSDVGDFAPRSSAATTRVAVELYAGPFLDGVYVTGAPEFDRWVDGERVALLQALERALERWLPKPVRAAIIRPPSNGASVWPPSIRAKLARSLRSCRRTRSAVTAPRRCVMPTCTTRSRATTKT